MGAFSACHGQDIADSSTKKETVQKDTAKQMNLLDEQTKMFNQVFTLAGVSPEENPTGGADNYLDLIEKMEGSEELKQQLREIYDLYDTSLDPTKKEELKIKFTKMFDEALAKSQSDQ
jgi:hypothetical protein